MAAISAAHLEKEALPGRASAPHLPERSSSTSRRPCPWTPVERRACTGRAGAPARRGAASQPAGGRPAPAATPTAPLCGSYHGHHCPLQAGQMMAAVQRAPHAHAWANWA